MAKIGSIDVSLVLSESVKNGANTTDHAVESGVSISDHTILGNKIIDITALMIGDDANTKLDKLLKFQKDGTLVYYQGKNKHKNMFIEKLDPDYDYKVSNGFKFNLTLKEVTIAVAKKVLLNAVNPNTKKADAKTNTKVKAITNGGTKQASKSGLGGTTGLSNVAVAKEVVRGKWGNGRTRVELLTKAGYNPKLVQAEVNKLLR